MSTYIVSDIHGCNLTFRKALKNIGLKKTDTLIVLGDLIDRGSDSKGVIDTIFLLLEHEFNVKCIKGNHEQMLLDSLDDISSKVNWMRNGGKETLKSFLTSDINKIPNNYIDFIQELPLYLEIENFIFIHACINMTIDFPFSDEFTLLWGRDWEKYYDSNWLGSRKIIHGHTPKISTDIELQIINENNIICIDNGSYMKNKAGYGAICVLKLDDFTVHFEKRID